MKITKTKIKGLLIIEPDCYGDHRGWFMESYNSAKFEEFGITTLFVQDNHSYSAKKGTLRGLHFQNKPMAQTKLVRCTRGEILDVAVDIRQGSPTYKQWVSAVLSAENRKQFYIPQGFAHGFLTLSDDVEIQYKVDNIYSKEHDRGIRFDDPALGVEWGGNDFILSDKDADCPNLENSDSNFIFEEM